MVDNSPVFNDSLRQLREALRAFVMALPTDIEVTLISTAPAPRFIYKQGNDRVKLMSSIDLLTPDGSAPRFIDALAEAAERAAKEKAGKENKNNFFPVFFIIGNNGVEGSSPRDYQVNKLFKQTIENAVTVHIVMLSNSSRQLDIGSGTNQIELGIKLTQITGGRYEAIAAQTRLTTLLPEFATQIARSHARQSHQYRITCQPPAGAKGQRVTAATNRSNLSAALTLDGRVPYVTIVDDIAVAHRWPRHPARLDGRRDRVDLHGTASRPAVSRADGAPGASSAERSPGVRAAERQERRLSRRLRLLPAVGALLDQHRPLRSR